MGGIPSFTGGDAGPAFSESRGTQNSNNWMASPFNVGSGSASSSAPVSTAGTGSAGLGGSSGTSWGAMALVGGAFVLIWALKK